MIVNTLTPSLYILLALFKRMSKAKVDYDSEIHYT